MRVLGIETSCDETGVAIFDQHLGLVADVLHTQIDLHIPYGGVVPELASRDHVRKAVPLIRKVMADAVLKAGDIDGVAYTCGPGLVGALLVGAGVGRSLAMAWDVPAVGVHHMEGHLLASLLEPEPPSFPFLALLVSGGHTQLVAVKGVGHYTLLGESLDDAVGEAFDKTAKLLGLDYPGGPALARLALTGDPERFRFPRPMTDRRGLSMSFSGLKTHAMTTFRRYGSEPGIEAHIARAFEDAVIDTLSIKSRRALEVAGMTRLVVAGGVGANLRLREKLTATASAMGATVHFPQPQFCTDNGAMIAYAGYRRLVAGQREPLAFQARPRWSLEELTPP